MRNQSSQFLKTHVILLAILNVRKVKTGFPFNLKEMLINIKKVKIPPGHPSANNVEMAMKQLGKAMKIGHLQNKNESETLNSFLVSYRDTSHLSTGVASAHMLFRDRHRSNLPHKSISECTTYR